MKKMEKMKINKNIGDTIYLIDELGNICLCTVIGVNFSDEGKQYKIKCNLQGCIFYIDECNEKGVRYLSEEQPDYDSECPDNYLNVDFHKHSIGCNSKEEVINFYKKIKTNLLNEYINKMEKEIETCRENIKGAKNDIKLLKENKLENFLRSSFLKS